MTEVQTKTRRPRPAALILTPAAEARIAALMARAPDAHFLHCLPARRGEEVTDGVMDGARSAVWLQAENRMHTARGALAWMVGA